MVDLGRKINGVNIKVRIRYGEKLREARPLYIDELNKLSIKRGDGFVTLIDLRRLFLQNKIDITEYDCENLKEEGILVQRDRLNVINVVSFVEKVFQDFSAFSKFMRKIMGMKIVRRFRIYKENKIKR